MKELQVKFTSKRFSSGLIIYFLSTIVQIEYMLQIETHVNFKETLCNGPVGNKALSPCTTMIDELEIVT